MKKKTINAFTLVEMLIVIVIIGILIAALLPRMQAAQWRARDVSRKTALSQIQSAIVTYQWDFGRWPGCESATSCSTWNNWMGIESISDELKAAWMNWTPKDPLGSSVSWLGSGDKEHYAYLVMTRNWTSNGWFALMAKTEVAWWSNWVYCGAGTGNWEITSSVDVSSLNICQTVEKYTDGTSWCIANTGTCKYSQDEQLRYLITY